MLRTSDYELIKILFEKRTSKLQVHDLYPVGTPISYSYKVYNPAYFEEVLLEQNKILERTANNYRDRFLVGKEVIY